MGTHHKSNRTTFETSWGKLRNIFEIKLTTDRLLPFLSAVDNNSIFVYFLMSQVWTMKLTEAMNICYVSVRAARTI